MQPETLMLYKLIVLYILNRVDFPMTNPQISDLITSHDYTSYFNVQEVLGELVDDGFISLQQTKNAALYRITNDGRETLSFFYQNVSTDIRDEIDLYLSEKKYQLREEVANVADYYEVRANEFAVELKVLEHDSSIIEIKLSVPTKAEAEAICAHWKKKNADIYAYVLNSLLADK